MSYICLYYCSGESSGSRADSGGSTKGASSVEMMRRQASRGHAVGRVGVGEVRAVIGDRQ